jgi:hypothetical protein
MKICVISIMLLMLAASAQAQLTARNPVDELKDQVSQALVDAKVPFTPDQEKQLALLIEEERQAAENLFGVTWDFSNGPPQGEQRDQALAGIRWMYDELKKKLPAYMTEPQRAAWELFDTRSQAVAASTETANDRAPQKSKVQQIRVTNNAFNVETATASGQGGLAGGGAKTEVIERGGIGAFHGNFASTFQDEKLNARNPFAGNKPPYYERTIDANISGPIIRDRLSLNFTISDNKKDNVGTVKAETLDGPFSLGVTRPTLNRSYDIKGVFQLAEAHSLNIGFQYAPMDSKNENVGDFTLPERASRTRQKTYITDLREISVLSDRTVHDVHLTWTKDHADTIPFSNALAVIVKDAFTGGGAQNQNVVDGNTYEVSNLIYYAGDKLTMRSGFQGWHRREQSLSEDNFFGEFTFSDLASYRAGKPLKYRITCCQQSFGFSQTQLSFFTQNDIKLTRTFTLMFGARYQVQTNSSDHNNVDPRIGFAYAIGNSTVIRGGVGVFSQWNRFDDIKTSRRLDGKQLYELQIDNPGWPDPFAAGSVRPRTRRVVSPDLRAAYYIPSQIVWERSLPKNLFVTVGYQVIRGVKPIRYRDLNAPLPGSGIKPFPDEGQIIQLESTGFSWNQHLKMTMRQRFSIFNVLADYAYTSGLTDQEADARGGGRGIPALPTNSYDRHLDWGRTAGPRHTFNTSVNSRMPVNVYLTTKISAKSGNFYNVTTGKDDNRDGVINDRPAGVDKYSELGPHFFDVSFNVTKAFQLNHTAAAAPQRSPAGNSGTGPQMNVFANLNNAFNMTHLGTPSGVMTSPFFKRPFNATAPRTVEVGMRFQF